MARKPSLKREVLASLDNDQLAEIVGGWSSNPACLLSIGPCVTFLCTANLACIDIG